MDILKICKKVRSEDILQYNEGEDPPSGACGPWGDWAKGMYRKIRGRIQLFWLRKRDFRTTHYGPIVEEEGGMDDEEGDSLIANEG